MSHSVEESKDDTLMETVSEKRRHPADLLANLYDFDEFLSFADGNRDLAQQMWNESTPAAPNPGLDSGWWKKKQQMQNADDDCWVKVPAELEDWFDQYAMRYLTIEDSMAIQEENPLGMCKQARVPDNVYAGLRTTSHTKRRKYALLATKAYPELDAEEAHMRNVAGFPVPVRGPVSFTHVTGAHLLPTFTSRAVPLLIGSTKVVFVLRAHLGQKMDIESVPQQVLQAIEEPSQEDGEAALQWNADISSWAKYLGEAHYDPPNIASMIKMGVAIQVELSVTAAISAGLSTLRRIRPFKCLPPT